VLRRLIKVSAAVIGLALAVTACSGRVEMGAAAIYGNHRITIANLDTEVTNLSQAAKQYPGVVNLTATQETQETLTWLIRFQINEEIARQAGISISTAQGDAGLALLYDSAKSEAQAQGLSNVTLNLILAANGIPPNEYLELGRYQAIETQFIENANGGTIPTSSSAQAASTKQFEHAQCVAAKALNILINPQFGRMNYATYLVVSAPVTVSRPAGPAVAPSLAGLAPAC
jgi:DNA-binding CsgD family transcriptional regulator